MEFNLGEFIDFSSTYNNSLMVEATQNNKKTVLTLPPSLLTSTISNNDIYLSNLNITQKQNPTNKSKLTPVEEHFLDNIETRLLPIKISLTTPKNYS